MSKEKIKLNSEKIEKRESRIKGFKIRTINKYSFPYNTFLPIKNSIWTRIHLLFL